MMTTCRLLCALLVLALCCCPSVCSTTGDVNQVTAPVAELSPKGKSEADGEGLASVKAAVPPGNPDPTNPKSTTEQGQGRSGSSEILDPEAVTEQSSVTVPAPPKGPGRESTGSTTEQEQGEAGDSGSSGTAADTAQTQGKPGLEETPSAAISNSQESSTASSTSDAEPSIPTGVDQANDVAVPLKEPDTTTATTTTNAPTTTTTTTTTTTGAPSRLPEIDGSLSSSAWVCASLLLAVSALAYTTLG
ncbi:hypothetical protein MOQ_006969 [Trypanosoma cruzi marinkellei]|uniref:Mucin TcMUCII n=1 Tax=Trypanosoma cruzi marinkellei TaxID=85056 RepID=K2NK13_TRYCR|nr:hypothetical protein MOQ_006969 [Trypanosoma cruzi marinkellei]